MQIGIAGIGKMGAAIAQRLIEVGHKVTVWNRSADKLKPLTAAGAAAAATPAELARNADAVITILTDAAAIDAVYTGASGLLAPDVRGKLFGAREGRPVGRVPGGRLDRSRATRQADRADGRRACRRRAGKAHPRTALPSA